MMASPERKRSPRGRGTLLVLLLTVLLASPAAWGGERNKVAGRDGASQTHASRTVRYYGTRKVVVPGVVSRIACGWPAQNSIIAMLGYGDKIVATTDVIKSVPLFRVFVPSIDRAAFCFSGSTSTVQMEELLKARPEVLFIPDTLQAGMERISRMGITVVPFRSNSLPAIVERTVITGEILGPDAYKRALDYQSYFRRNLARVQAVVAKIPRGKRLRVYHCIRNPFSTAGAHSLVQDWMELAGAVNVAENWFRGNGTASVTSEQILASNPDIIIAMNAADAEELRHAPRWSGLRARRSNRIFVNPRGMFWWCRETAEEALQVLWVAKLLYPEHFRELNMEKETRYFYQHFYGYNLSDRQVQGILYPS